MEGNWRMPSRQRQSGGGDRLQQASSRSEDGGSGGLRYSPPPHWSLCTLPPSTCPHLSPGPANRPPSSTPPPEPAAIHSFSPLVHALSARRRVSGAPTDYGSSPVRDNIMSVARRKSIFATINDLVGLSEEARAKPDALDLRLKGDEPSVVHQPMPLLASVAQVGFFDGSFMLKSQQKPPIFSFYPWMPAATSPSVSYQSLLLLSAGGGRDHPQLGKSSPALTPSSGATGLSSSSTQASRSCDFNRSTPTPRCQLKLPAHPPSSLNLIPGNNKQNGGQRHAPRFQCADCNRSYSTFSGLSKHRQFHCTSQLKRHFACKYCEKQYSSLGALKMHIRTHTLPCKCDLCGKAFSRPWLLQGHLRTHTGEKPFCCAHCGRAFADRSNLRAHLQTHSDVKKYSCKSCLKTFSRMSLLTKHENNGCPSLVAA